jgi:hypothetical protein
MCAPEESQTLGGKNDANVGEEFRRCDAHPISPLA